MSQPLPSEPRRFAWWPFALVGFTCALYFDTFFHEFTYDDIDCILKNDALRDISNLAALLDPARYFEVAVETSYRPVVTLMYFIESALFGTNPTGFHAFGHLLHAACGVLTASLCLRLGLDRPPAFFAAAVFLSHPAATEVVNSVGFHEDLIALFFLLAALTMTLHGTAGRPVQMVGATLLYFLALLSKEVSIFFPCAVWFILRRQGWDVGQRLRMMAWLGAALAIYAMLRFSVFLPPPDVRTIYKPGDMPVKETVLTMSVIAVNYIRLFFLPIGLCAAHPVFVYTQINAVAAAAIAVLAGFGALFVRSRLFPVRLGGLWCALFLLPVSQIVATAQPSSERFLYVPLAGATIAFVAAWDDHFSDSRVWRRWIPCLIVLALSALTFQRNPVWRTQEILFKNVVRKYPNSSFALNALGARAFGLGYDALAESYFKQAIAHQPANYHYLANLATLYFRMMRYAESIPILEDMMAIHPEDGNPRLKLAWSYWMTGDYEKCRRQVKTLRRVPLRDTRDQASFKELEGNIAALGDTGSIRPR